MQIRTITINSRKNNKSGWTRRPGTRMAAAVAAAVLASAVGLATPSSARLDEPIDLPIPDAPPAVNEAPLPPPVPATPAAPAIKAEPAEKIETPEKIEAPEKVDAPKTEPVAPKIEVRDEVEAPKKAETPEKAPEKIEAPEKTEAPEKIETPEKTPEKIEIPEKVEAPATPETPAPPPVAATPIPLTTDAPSKFIELAEPVKPAAAAPAATQPTAPAITPVTPVIAEAPATRPAEGVVGLFENVPENGRINLLVGRSMVVKTRGKYARLSLTQPDVVADNELADHTSILLTAKKAGTAQLIVWDDKERSQVVEIMVEVDLNALTELVKKNFPTADVQLSSANGSMVVRGRVPNLQMAEQITQLLSAYGKVLNFLEMSGGQQVMLQVRFAEVSRSATTALGVNFGFADNQAGRFGSNVPGGGPFGLGDTVGTITKGVGANVTLFGGGKIGSTEFDIFLSALRSNNLLRVLAEPNLSTVSGKEAQFLAGGEFPIPVPQSGGSGNAAITVEYKQFGVRLSFIPVVLGDGKIRLQGTAEVSDLDFSRSVSLNGFNIPSLTKRTVTTTIELNEGQTFAVAGLLNNRITASKQAVPLLGDIPVLGALFRSVRYDRNETELVVLVTPRLVEGMNPKAVPELPGERWRYPTEADMFLFQYLGGPGKDPANATKPAPVQYRGPYGFVPANNGPRTRAESGRVTAVDDVRE